MANNYKIRVLMDTSSVDAASQKILKDTRQFANQWEKAAARAEAAIKRAYAAMGNVPGVGGGGGGGGGRGGTSGADKITIAQINSTGKVATAQINATGKVTAAQVSATGKVTAAGLAGNAKVTVAQTNSAAKVTAAQTAGNAKVTAAGLAGNAKVTAAQTAGTAKVTSAQTAATASMTNAQVSAAAKVTTAQLSGTAKVTAAQVAGNAKVTSATIAGRAKVKAARISATRNRKRPPNAAQLATAQASIQAANTLAATQTQTARANAAQTIRTARAAGAAGTLSPQEVKAQIAAANSLANAEISAANRVAAVKVSAANQVAHAGASPGAQAAATLKANDKILAAETAAQAKIAAARTAGANQVTAAQNAAATKAAAAIKKNLTDVEVAEAAKNKLIERTNKRRVKAATDALDTEKKGFLESVIGATALGQAVTGVGAALLGLKIGHDLVVGFAKIMQDVQANANRTADDIIRLAGELRFIKSMAPGNDAEQREQHLDIRTGSGMTEGQARQFAEADRNKIGLLPNDVLDEKGRQEVIRLGARASMPRIQTEGDALQQGNLLGVVTRLTQPEKNGKIDPRRAVAETVRVAKILQAGTQDPKQAAEEYQKYATASTTTDKDLAGMFHSPSEAAAGIAFTSQYAEGDTATKLRMYNREFRALGKIRKAKGALTTQGQTVRDAGVEEAMNPNQVAEKMMEYIDKNLKKGEAVDQFLLRHGFDNRKANDVIMQTYNAYKGQTFKTAMDMANAPLDLNEPEREATEFLSTDISAKVGVSKAKADAARYRAGLKHLSNRAAMEEAGEGYEAMEYETTGFGNLEMNIARIFSLGGDPKAAILQDRAMMETREKAYALGLTKVRGRDPLNMMMPGAGAGAGYLFGTSKSETERLLKSIDAHLEAQNKLNPAAPGPKANGVPVPLGPRPAPAGVAARP